MQSNLYLVPYIFLSCFIASFPRPTTCTHTDGRCAMVCAIQRAAVETVLSGKHVLHGAAT